MWWCLGGYPWQGCHGYKVHSAAVLGSTSLLGTSLPIAPLLLSVIQRINTTHNLPNGVFPLQKNNHLLQQGQAKLLKTAWHLNNIHVHVSSLNFKPAYYTSLKSDKWIYTGIHHSAHLFSKVFLARCGKSKNSDQTGSNTGEIQHPFSYNKTNCKEDIWCWKEWNNKESKPHG